MQLNYPYYCYQQQVSPSICIDIKHHLELIKHFVTSTRSLFILGQKMKGGGWGEPFKLKCLIIAEDKLKHFAFSSAIGAATESLQGLFLEL